MKAVLVFIDGTICDIRPQLHLLGTPELYEREAILKALAVPGSVQCLQELAQRYQIVYIGARPASALPLTEEWLRMMGFPRGPVYLASTQEERVTIVSDFREKFNFFAGIGDRWDDNELHLEIGCLSIIVKEHEGNWDIVRRYLLSKEILEKAN